jgi:hypothetical protein
MVLMDMLSAAHGQNVCNCSCVVCLHCVKKDMVVGAFVCQMYQFLGLATITIMVYHAVY